MDNASQNCEDSKFRVRYLWRAEMNQSTNCSEGCKRIQTRMSEVERTICNKDVHIKMLQNQLKKIEELYKKNLQESEQMRFKYCLASQELNTLRFQKNDENAPKEKCYVDPTHNENEIKGLREEFLKWRQQCETILCSKETSEEKLQLPALQNIETLIKEQSATLNQLSTKIGETQLKDKSNSKYSLGRGSDPKIDSLLVEIAHLKNDFDRFREQSESVQQTKFAEIKNNVLEVLSNNLELQKKIEQLTHQTGDEDLIGIKKRVSFSKMQNLVAEPLEPKSSARHSIIKVGNENLSEEGNFAESGGSWEGSQLNEENASNTKGLEEKIFETHREVVEIKNIVAKFQCFVLEIRELQNDFQDFKQINVFKFQDNKQIMDELIKENVKTQKEMSVIKSTLHDLVKVNENKENCQQINENKDVSEPYLKFESEMFKPSLEMAANKEKKHCDSSAGSESFVTIDGLQAKMNEIVTEIEHFSSTIDETTNVSNEKCGRGTTSTSSKSSVESDETLEKHISDPEFFDYIRIPDEVEDTVSEREEILQVFMQENNDKYGEDNFNKNGTVKNGSEELKFIAEDDFEICNDNESLKLKLVNLNVYENDYKICEDDSEPEKPLEDSFKMLTEHYNDLQRERQEKDKQIKWMEELIGCFNQINAIRRKSSGEEEKMANLSGLVEKVNGENSRLKSTINGLRDNLKVKMNEMDNNKSNDQTTDDPKNLYNDKTRSVATNTSEELNRNEEPSCSDNEKIDSSSNRTISKGNSSCFNGNENGKSRGGVSEILGSYMMYLEKQLEVTSKIENEVENLRKQIREQHESFKNSKKSC